MCVLPLAESVKRALLVVGPSSSGVGGANLEGEASIEGLRTSFIERQEIRANQAWEHGTQLVATVDTLLASYCLLALACLVPGWAACRCRRCLFGWAARSYVLIGAPSGLPASEQSRSPVGRQGGWLILRLLTRAARTTRALLAIDGAAR